MKRSSKNWLVTAGTVAVVIAVTLKFKNEIGEQVKKYAPSVADFLGI